MKVKGRISGFLCMLLTVVYAIYIVSYFSGIVDVNLSAAVATALVTPHMVCVAIAAIMSIVGFLERHGGRFWFVGSYLLLREWYF